MVAGTLAQWETKAETQNMAQRMEYGQPDGSDQ